LRPFLEASSCWSSLKGSILPNIQLPIHSPLNCSSYYYVMPFILALFNICLLHRWWAKIWFCFNCDTITIEFGHLKLYLFLCWYIMFRFGNF
jgi:hypothetical protein